MGLFTLQTAVCVALAIAGMAAGQEAPMRIRRARGTQAPEGPVDCGGDYCEARWTKCAGTEFEYSTPCCAGDVCVTKNEFYSQCRPASYAVPSGWDGEMLSCGTMNPLEGAGIAGMFAGYGDAGSGGYDMM